MRLRFKMMAALLATGLGSVALVGGVAYVSVNYKVDSLRRQQAAEHFHTYMTAYLTEYGDWQTAIATESFDRFVRRQEGERPSAGADDRPGGGELPSEMLERMPPRINEQARLSGPLPASSNRQQGDLQRAQRAEAATPSERNAERPPRGGSGVAPERDGQRPPRGESGPPPERDGQRPPRGEFDPPPERDGQRPPRGEFGPPPERDGQRPPRGEFGPPPERDGQRPPRGEFGPPPERDGQHPPRGEFGPPPDRDGQRPPRGEFGAPPERDGQRLPRGEFGPPPERDGQRPPRGESGPPPEGRDLPAPRDGFGPSTEERVPDAGGRTAQRSEPQPAPQPARPRPAASASQPTVALEATQASGEPAVRPVQAVAEGSPTHRPPPPRRGDGPPPFRFILTDASYRVLLGGGQFSQGQPLPEKLRPSARPIVVKERTVAYMSSEGTLAPTPQEQKYLDALYNSLLWGVAAAAGLATLLGVLLSRGLSRSLSGLTRAVKRMKKGELRQEVPVKGKDEVAALAAAFNEMSAQLAHSHEELNTSHAKIVEQAEQLRELSIRDALTQLYNRRHFDEQASTLFNQAVRHKRPLALVICDIDHFKKINDTYSHAIGDVVLRHVGSILRNHMRLSDLVARYGGEEFVMAFPETAGPQAAALCDKLRALIEAFPWHEVHPELKVTMSMGVYADIAAGSAETMLQKADALLYRAKNSGRNRVCCA